MKIWRFDTNESGMDYTYYRTTEAEAKTLKELLDENGEQYTMRSYPSLHNLIENLSKEWDAESLTDSEALQEVMELLERLDV